MFLCIYEYDFIGYIGLSKEITMCTKTLKSSNNPFESSVKVSCLNTLD